MNKNNKNSSSSINVWDIANDFKNIHLHFKYCIDSKCFYNYDLERKIWYSQTLEELKSSLLSFIVKKYPQSYKHFNPKNVEGIILILQRHTFSLQKSKSLANSKGLLLSFQNCVLNTSTGETFSHKPEFYINHTLQCDYDPNASILNTPMQEFLTQISNNNPKVLCVIRAILYLIITNNLTYQIALYVYGPGGTGKSTFTNMISHLLGPTASVTTNLRNLQSRFGLSPLKDKLLLIISELPLTLGSEPQILKNIIGGDVLTSEEKYKTPTQMLPNSFVIVTSNTVWNFQNSSTGIARRFVYIVFSYKPKETNNNLFNLTKNNQATGILTGYLPHLIN